MKKQHLEAGRIVGTHGVRGEVRVQPWADSAEFLTRFKRFYIDGSPVNVTLARAHKDMLIAKLVGVDDVNAAMALRDKTVFIDRNDARLPKGSFFVQDIIGADVEDENGAPLGKLQEVLELPGGSVYVVQGQREILIPDVPEFILSVDPENNLIRVHLIEGM